MAVDLTTLEKPPRSLSADLRSQVLWRNLRMTLLVLTCFAPLAIWCAGRVYEDARLALTSTNIVIGQLVENREYRSTKEHYYTCEYRYQVDGRAFSGSNASIDPLPGPDCKVEYVVGAPQISRLPEAQSPGPRSTMRFLLLLLGVASLAAVIWRLRGNQKILTILRDWLWVHAELVDQELVEEQKGTLYLLTYQYWPHGASNPLSFEVNSLHEMNLGDGAKEILFYNPSDPNERYFFDDLPLELSLNVHGRLVPIPENRGSIAWLFPSLFLLTVLISVSYLF